MYWRVNFTFLWPLLLPHSVMSMLLKAILYHRERTPKFRKRSKRSQVCNLARCGWHNTAAHKHHHKPPWFCTGGIYSRGEGGGGRCREGEVKGCVLAFRIATWRVTSCAPRCVLLLSKRCFCDRGVWTFFYLFVVGQFKKELFRANQHLEKKNLMKA